MSSAEERPGAAHPSPALSAEALSVQCVSAVAVALLAIELGASVPAKIVGAAGGALITAFLIAPGPQRHRRVVAVSIVLALVAVARRTAAAAASERRRERPRPRDAVDWAGCVPGNWTSVGIAAAVGLAGAGLATTARGAWESPDRAARVAVPEVAGRTRPAAVALLRDRGLRATPRPEPSSVAHNYATRTEPPAGAQVQRDDTVTLFVSSGRARAQTGGFATPGAAIAATARKARWAERGGMPYTGRCPDGFTGGQLADGVLCWFSDPDVPPPAAAQLESHERLFTVGGYSFHEEISLALERSAGRWRVTRVLSPPALPDDTGPNTNP